MKDFWLCQIFGGFLAGFCMGFLADFWHYASVLYIAHLVIFTDMQGQSIAKMLLKALYRLIFGL
jgi:hypothetical protein